MEEKEASSSTTGPYLALEEEEDTPRPPALESSLSFSSSPPPPRRLKTRLDSLLAASSEDDPILRCLMIAPAERTQRDLYPLLEFVKSLKFFRELLSSSPETVEAIAARLEVEEYFADSHVFNEGEEGHHFYIILSGAVEILKRKRVNGLAQFINESVSLVKLGCGQYFGENALDNKNGLRTASAVCLQASTLLTLHREDYLTILAHTKARSFEALKKLLRTSIFRSWTAEQIDRVAHAAVHRIYSPNAEIFTAGTAVNSLMVVKSGIVKLVKAISKQDFAETIERVEKKLSLPAVKSYSKSIDSFDSSTTTIERSLTIDSHSDYNPPSSRIGRLSSDEIVPTRTPKPMSPSLSLPSIHTKTNRLTPTTTPSALLSPARRSSPNSKNNKRNNDSNAQNISRSPSRSRISRTLPKSPTTESAASFFQRAPSSSSNDLTRSFSLDERPFSSSPSQRNVPNGFWVLGCSDLYLRSTKPLKVSTPNDNGLSTVTSVHCDAYSRDSSVEFTVATVMTGQVIGEICVIDPEQLTPLSAVCSTTVELICIDVDILVDMGIRADEEIMNELVDDWKFRNPPIQEVQKHLQTRYEWQEKKSRIMQKYYKNKNKT